MDIRRSSLISWSEFIKISKFCKILNIKPQAVSRWLRYNDTSLSESNKQLIYDTIKNYLNSLDI